MIIFPTTEISWGGKEYTTKVTMGMIARIENTFSLSQLYTRVLNGDAPPISHLSILYGHLLRSDRCDVSDLQVYNSMMGDIEDSKVSQVEIMEMCMQGLRCCFPDRPEEEVKTQPKKKVSRKKR